MLSPTTTALTYYTSATNNETEIATGAGTTAEFTPSQGTGYILSDIGFCCWIWHRYFPLSRGEPQETEIFVSPLKLEDETISKLKRSQRK